MKPLQRREPPDFERFLKVIRRQGDGAYVPFFELCIDPSMLEPLSGLRPPEGMNFAPTSPTYEATFRYFLDWCAQVGFDLYGLQALPGCGDAVRHPLILIGTFLTRI